MSYKTKLKIGDFSQMMQVTVKTLRHYEQKGLLKPDEVDEWTGYRYYTVEQMQRLNNIRKLQQLGFSLDEIGLLYEDDSHDPTVSQLSRKIRETEQQLRMLMDRREKLLNWRRSIKEIKTMEKLFAFHQMCVTHLFFNHLATFFSNKVGQYLVGVRQRGSRAFAGDDGAVLGEQLGGVFSSGHVFFKPWVASCPSSFEES